jgi:hypothetical protein
MAIYSSPDIQFIVTSTPSACIQDNFQNTIKRSFYVINDGSQTVSYRLYGSPDGLKNGDKDNMGSLYSITEINKHWIDANVAGTISSGAPAIVDFSS